MNLYLSATKIESKDNALNTSLLSVEYNILFSDSEKTLRFSESGLTGDYS
jgi:hypothetical protein